MKKSTRLMGALLALIFVFALLPVSAFAAEPENTEELVITDATESPDVPVNPDVPENNGKADGTNKELKFEATTDKAGNLINAKGMKYSTKEDGEYKPVDSDKFEIVLGEADNYTIFVKTGDDAEPTKLEVGRMHSPTEFISNITFPSSADATDGKIEFSKEILVTLSSDKGTPVTEKTTVIDGLSAGNYYLQIPAEGSNLASNALPIDLNLKATVTFAAGEHGQGEMHSMVVNLGTAIEKPACQFKPVDTDKVKYEFAGWATDENAVETDGKYTINGDTVFTALWKEIPVEPEKPVMKDITLTFDYNDGSGKTSSETKTVEEGSNAEFVLPEAPYQRDEHDFQGWEIAGTVFKAGDKVYNSVDATAKAVWKEREPLHYILRFDANGGTGAPEPQDMGMNKHREVRLTVTDKVPTKDGMKFMGWSLHKGTEVVLQPGDVCLLNEKFPDLTVYAVWVDPAAAPKTGDESNVALWASIAAVSLVVVAGAVFFILKKNKKTDDDDQTDTME